MNLNKYINFIQLIWFLQKEKKNYERNKFKSIKSLAIYL